jgi:putative aldouronate transport system permease protein
MQKVKVFDLVNYTVLAIIGFICLYPFWYEICISFTPFYEAMKGGFYIIPRGFTTAAYEAIFDSKSLLNSYMNSIFVTVTGTVLNVILTAAMAYPLTKKFLKGRKIFFLIIIIPMIFDGGMIPKYLLLKGLGLVGSLWALILVWLVWSYNVIIMKNFLGSIPSDIEESAFIDGANPIQSFVLIILPLSKAVLATCSLWVAVSLWNDFYSALLYLNSQKTMTLPLLLKETISGMERARRAGEYSKVSSVSVIASTIIVSIVPIICTYPFLQKYFIKGVMLGSVKE